MITSNASAAFVQAPQEKGLTIFASDFLMGGVSAAVSKTATTHIERVKLLIQNKDEMLKAGRLVEPYKEIGNCFTRTIKDEGFGSLWRGNSWVTVTGFTHHAIIKCVVRADLIQTETTSQITVLSFVVSVSINICFGMSHLLGKPVIVGDDKLTWTLLKHKEPDDSRSDIVDYEPRAENYSRLSVALDVMHECFEPVKELHTWRDIVENVIFSRWSELNRLNFQGSYTVLLERNDELITVATVRVYGEKVAEAPLLALRFQHRRLGICCILMNELEKTLMELGVERLVLPAVPVMLDTWTTSFGFSVMNESERVNFLDYTSFWTQLLVLWLVLTLLLVL